MKILWISHNVPHPPTGGVLQRNFNLVRQTARRAELHLVALRQRALCPDEVSLARSVEELEQVCRSVRVFPIDWEESRAALLRLGAGVVVGAAAYDVARYHSSACHRYLENLSANGIDAVHVDTLGLVPYRKHLAQVPAALNHHNIESAMMSRRAAAEPNFLRRWVMGRQAGLLRQVEVTAARSFSVQLVVSELDGERLRRVVPGVRSEVVPNGVDTAFFDRPADTDPDNHRLVFVGSHSWYPNRDAVEWFLEQIWPAIVAARPRATFTVVGRNPCPAVVAASKRDARVRVLGFVDDLRGEVARSAVFVCPFRQGGGTRLKVLDALAMRKAIVSTSMGAEGIRMDDGEHYLQADTPEKFAAAALRLFGDAALRRKLGEAGRDLVVRNYDWNVVGDRLFSAYHGIAGGARRGPVQDW